MPPSSADRRRPLGGNSPRFPPFSTPSRGEGDSIGAGTARDLETGDPYGSRWSSGAERPGTERAPRSRATGRETAQELRDLERRDTRREELRDQKRRDARRFGSVSGSSADADDATERYATRHSAACGVANVVDRTPPCTRSANGEPRPTRGERGAPRVERGVEFDVRFDARHDRLVGPVRFPPAVHRRLAPGGFSSRTRSPSGPGRPRDLSIPG